MPNDTMEALPDTTPGAIRALRVDKSVVPRITRLNLDHTNKTDISEVHETFHRDLTPVISRLQRETGRRFVMERFVSITRSGDLLVGLCVTRIE